MGQLIGVFERCQYQFNLFSARCPESRPIAQTTGIGTAALNFCCPTINLVQPGVGQTQNNQCTRCEITDKSNCDNYWVCYYACWSC